MLATRATRRNTLKDYEAATEPASYVSVTARAPCDAENAAAYLTANLPTYQTAPDMTMTMAG